MKTTKVINRKKYGALKMKELILDYYYQINSTRNKDSKLIKLAS